MTEGEAIHAARRLIEASGMHVGPLLGTRRLPEAVRRPAIAGQGDLWIVGFHKLVDNETATIEFVDSVTSVSIHVDDSTGIARFFGSM